MTINAFYIFDRHCSCIYSREYDHKSTAHSSHESVNQNNDSDMAKLLFGVIYSLKNVSAKLGASKTPENEEDAIFSQATNALRSFSTGQYRIHFFESLSNFKFILVSDLTVDNLQTQLWQLYSTIFVKHVVQNALVPVEFGASKLNNADFTALSDAFLSSLPAFA